MENSTSRREFIKSSSLIAGGALVSGFPAIRTHKEKTLRIALIGAGKRGAGAAAQALKASKGVKLVALADVFKDQLDSTYASLTKVPGIQDQIDVPEKHKFVGFDAYQKATELADVVLLASPAPFRPEHFRLAIESGKHVFMEKPLASDAPGIRQILATGELATKKGLNVVVGLQNRYDPAYQEMVKRIHDGMIGDLVSASCYYNVGNVNMIPRQEGWTEMEYQLRNWRYFNWLWAGSPAGLQIHNDDVVNWVKGGPPVKVVGNGGRAAFKGPNNGDIYDHFFNEYEYADGFKLNSQIRHINGCWNRGGNFFYGSKGKGDLKDGFKDYKGNLIWKYSGKQENPYQLEHDELFAAINGKRYINDTVWGANSTMACIMGRMAAHSGQLITWDSALASEVSIVPPKLAWDAAPLSVPDEKGEYHVAVPGIDKV
ncbi:Gfo/Idh/MocA family oxidoreductase [Ravibacter arvi]|uniref:Gfo/Idh/MocA family oxidoreductase n=1 Tax=Ravibacter arvi TaxID=2051041 RepID=A0ABP8M174_9BACT